MKKKKTAKKTAKPKLWTSAKADKLFSLWVRARDGKCVRCGKTSNLQCSHFWSRQISATRYEPDNCVALCAGCHLYKWEIEKQGEYRDFMIWWLGDERYESLRRQSQSIVKRRDAIVKLMTWLA